MAKKTNYSFQKGLKKAVVNMILIGLPMLVQVLPVEWANITLGGALVLIVNYIKVRFAKNI